MKDFVQGGINLFLHLGVLCAKSTIHKPFIIHHSLFIIHDLLLGVNSGGDDGS